MVKITSRLAESRSEGETAAFSYEFFAPCSCSGEDALNARIYKLSRTEPLFINIVGTRNLEDAKRSLFLASRAKRFEGLTVVVHISIAGMTKVECMNFVSECKIEGVYNLIIEDFMYGFGSAPIPERRTEYYKSAVDLIQDIRKNYGALFCIGVLGFPSGFGERGAYEEDLNYVVEKCAAGADVVIAQHVFLAATFESFVKDIRSKGVTVPILPSVLMIQNYASLETISNFTGVHLPAEKLREFQSAREDIFRVQKLGLELTTSLCRDLFSLSNISGTNTVHFVTLNLEVVLFHVLNGLELIGANAARRRKLPWRPSGDESRRGEDVRPISWANRPFSYVERTREWGHFPSGRWSTGNVNNPSHERVFRDVDVTSLINATLGSVDERRAIWGANPISEKDIWNVFADYVKGNIPRLPWCDGGALMPETNTIANFLVELNSSGFLTTNSQPRVNAIPSEDPTFGWGGPGGHVWQKAYIECFCPPEHLASFVEVVTSYPSITFYAVNAAGTAFTNANLSVPPVASASNPCTKNQNFASSFSSLTRRGGVSAVTWGVFPDREIEQPTVMDPDSFLNAWRAEAFALWSQGWASIYEPTTKAYDVLYEIHDSYFLLNVVDNDFATGDIFTPFLEALTLVKEKGIRNPSTVAESVNNSLDSMSNKKTSPRSPTVSTPLPRKIIEFDVGPIPMLPSDDCSEANPNDDDPTLTHGKLTTIHLHVPSEPVML